MPFTFPYMFKLHKWQASPQAVVKWSKNFDTSCCVHSEDISKSLVVNVYESVVNTHKQYQQFIQEHDSTRRLLFQE